MSRLSTTCLYMICKDCSEIVQHKCAYYYRDYCLQAFQKEETMKIHSDDWQKQGIQRMIIEEKNKFDVSNFNVITCVAL